MLNEDFDDYLEMARSLLGGHDNVSDLWQANDYVNLALHLRPDDTDAWILKSQILSSLDDPPAALAAAEMAVRRAPRKAEPRYVRAAVLTDMELYFEALQEIEEAFGLLSINDEWLLEDLYYEKAALLDLLDREQEARETFELGLSHCPDSLLLKAGLEPLRREQIRRAFRVINGGKSP